MSEPTNRSVSGIVLNLNPDTIISQIEAVIAATYKTVSNHVSDVPISKPTRREGPPFNRYTASAEILSEDGDKKYASVDTNENGLKVVLEGDLKQFYAELMEKLKEDPITGNPIFA